MCSGFCLLALWSVGVYWQVLCALVCTRDSPVPRRSEENLLQRPPNCTREKEVSLQEWYLSQEQDEEGVVGSWLFPGGITFLTWKFSVMCTSSDAAAYFIQFLRVCLDGSQFLFPFLGAEI